MTQDIQVANWDGKRVSEACQVYVTDITKVVERCRGIDILAALGHQRERRILLPGPVAAHVRVCKVVEADWLDVYNIDELTQSSGANNLSQSLGIRGISEDLKVNT